LQKKGLQKKGLQKEGFAKGRRRKQKEGETAENQKKWEGKKERAQGKSEEVPLLTRAKLKSNHYSFQQLEE
jgi:hypothetical protein